MLTKFRTMRGSKSESGELLPDAELHGKQIDAVETVLRNLRLKYPKNVRFYTHYYDFYRKGGFGAQFPCRHPSKLVSMKPEGSIHLPCAFVTLFESQAPLEEIFASKQARMIISQEATLWDFCKGCSRNPASDSGFWIPSAFAYVLAPLAVPHSHVPHSPLTFRHYASNMKECSEDIFSGVLPLEDLIL